MTQEQQVLAAIKEERRRQDAKWGGPEHDDTHSPEEWRKYITEHTCKALDYKVGMPNLVERVIQVAALGFALADCLERREQDIENLKDAM